MSVTRPARSTPTVQSKPGAVERRSRARTLAATSLGFAVVQLDVSVVNVAIKPIGSDLGATVSSMQWVVSAYTVAFAGLILSAGALGDRIGARRTFVAGFALFTVASAVCGLAPSLGVLIAARTVQGVGAAVLVPCSLTLLNHTFVEPSDRARAVGLWAAGASVALSGGPLVGGLLIATLGWRAIFFINAPIGVAGIVLTLRWATETSRSRSRGIDLWGQLTAIVSLTALAGGDDRRWSTWLHRPRGAGGLRARGRVGCRVPGDRGGAEAPDAAAAAVPLADVQFDVRHGAGDQHRLLRPDLRPQPVLPARPAPVVAAGRACVCSADRCRAGREPGRRASRRTVGSVERDHGWSAADARGRPDSSMPGPAARTPRWWLSSSRSASGSG